MLPRILIMRINHKVKSKNFFLVKNRSLEIIAVSFIFYYYHFCPRIHSKEKYKLVIFRRRLL